MARTLSVDVGNSVNTGDFQDPFPLWLGSNSGQNRAKCLALKSSLNLENTTVLDVVYVAADSTLKPRGPCVQGDAHVSVPLCRVEFSTQTSATSAIRAEAWLPDEWYGRFWGLGNGGLGGCILYDHLNYGSAMHFATVGSNNGHDGYVGLPFLGNEEVLNDFAFRSIHTEAIVGKQISYYLGESGTQTALKYPQDFDGILAGAPATNFNRVLHCMGMMARTVGAPNYMSSFIPPELWKLVAAEVLSQCDTLDGVRDGIITEPDACNFRPEVLQPGDTQGI
ncbi:tannase and feruloyl esterase-domain-containing protein [Mycena rebaudengoi]|nr:tannase and feruloyl esterase-domain-containing protein [Mycena rebaudengoi]